MRGGATGMSAASQMSGLSCGTDKGSAAAAAAAAAASAMQFPLSQRRKRRVLFTQAQVRRVRWFVGNGFELFVVEKNDGDRKSIYVWENQKGIENERVCVCLSFSVWERKRECGETHTHKERVRDIERDTNIKREREWERYWEGHTYKERERVREILRCVRLERKNK